MKKHLITLILPVIVALSCSLAVWANEQGAAQPGCAKMQKGGGCDLAAKGTAGCDKCAKRQAADEAKAAGAAPCEKCAKAGKTEPCAKCAQAGKTEPCAKCAKAGKDAAGCEKCAKQSAEGKAAGAQCDKCAKAKQAEAKPCCDKGKAVDK